MFQIADMHCDTISALYNFKKLGDSLRSNSFHVDLERLKDANYLLQTFALFQDISKGEDPYLYAKDLLKLYKDEIKRNEDIITPVLFKEDLDRIVRDKKIGSLLTLEEGEAFKGEVDKLREFYDEGVRLITLTWNNPNSLGFPNKVDLEKKRFVPDTENGLTVLGIEFLSEMEDLGILIDVSHLSDKGFYDVYENTKRPFIASHSNARALSPVPRNLTDDMIEKIADRGGVIGLNFCGNFIDNKTNYATLEGIVEHAKYLRDKGGIESIGLGTDFDGIPDSMEIKDCSEMPVLFDALQKSGFSESDVEKIASGNVLRVFREVLTSRS